MPYCCGRIQLHSEILIINKYLSYLQYQIFIIDRDNNFRICSFSGKKCYFSCFWRFQTFYLFMPTCKFEKVTEGFEFNCGQDILCRVFYRWCAFSNCAGVEKKSLDTTFSKGFPPYLRNSVLFKGPDKKILFF